MGSSCSRGESSQPKTAPASPDSPKPRLIMSQPKSQAGGPARLRTVASTLSTTSSGWEVKSSRSPGAPLSAMIPLSKPSGPIGDVDKKLLAIRREYYMALTKYLEDFGTSRAAAREVFARVDWLEAGEALLAATSLKGRGKLKLVKRPELPYGTTHALRAGAQSDGRFAELLSRTQGCCEEETALRGITLAQLDRVYDLASRLCTSEKWTSQAPGQKGTPLAPAAMTLYDLDVNLIRPATASRGCSLVELMAEGPQPAHYFVSHWWGERVSDFIACLRQLCADQKLEPAATTFWVCAYALRQHKLGAEMDGGVGTSPFVRALQLTDGVVTVLDGGGVYFTRAWCALELYKALVDDAPLSFAHHIYTRHKHVGRYGQREAVGLVRGFAKVDAHELGRKVEREAHFPRKLLSLSSAFLLDKAEASDPGDLRAIRADVGASKPTLEATLRARFASASLGTLLRKGGDAAALELVLTDLRNSWLRALAVLLTADKADKAEAVSAGSVERLFDALPKTLAELSLQRLPVATALARPKASKALALRLGDGSLLQLLLTECEVADSHALWLAAPLAKPTSKLQMLNLRGNLIGDKGARALGDALRKNTSLHILDLSFNSIGDDGACALADALCTASCALVSLFLASNQMGDEGAKALGKTLERNATLNLLHLAHTLVTSPGALALAAGLRGNEALELLDLGGCTIGHDAYNKLKEAGGKRCRVRFHAPTEPNAVGASDRRGHDQVLRGCESSLSIVSTASGQPAQPSRRPAAVSPMGGAVGSAQSASAAKGPARPAGKGGGDPSRSDGSAAAAQKVDATGKGAAHAKPATTTAASRAAVPPPRGSAPRVPLAAQPTAPAAGAGLRAR